jgi:signal transduction histidine kinase
MLWELSFCGEGLKIGARLVFAFITVILVMVASYAGYTLFTNYLTAKQNALKSMELVTGSLMQEFQATTDSNLRLANNYAHDSSLTNSMASGDIPAVAKQVNSLIDKGGLTSFISLIEKSGRLLYSSETPGKANFNARDGNQAVESVLQNKQSWKGATVISPAGTISITGMAPITSGASEGGLVAVSEPIDSELLTGLATKFALQQNPINGLEFALFSSRYARIIAVSSGLSGQSGSFIAKVNAQGEKALRGDTFEADSRVWKTFPIFQDKNNKLGVLLLSMPMAGFTAQLIPVITQAAVCGGIALVFGFIFAAGIGGKINYSLGFLTKRAQDLAAQKPSLAPLEGLTGEFYELGELLDTTVSSMRASIHSLKAQLAAYDKEMLEKGQLVETANTQLNTVSRQLSNQNRQLAEVSKQINFTNQQAVLLQHKLDAVLQISTEGYLVLDQYGNVILANPVVLNWLGATEGEIAGLFCFDLLRKPGEGPQGRVAQPFSRHGGDPADLIALFFPEGIVYHKNQGKATQVLIHLQPIVLDESNIQGFVMVLRDKSLRGEVSGLRQEMVTVLADSIRNPLAALEATWVSLLETSSHSMHPSTGQALAQLHNKYQTLISLLDKLITTYGGSAPLPVVAAKPIVLTRLISDCLQEIAPVARERQLMLDYKTVTGLPTVSVDKETLTRILLEILDKIVHITSAGGRVRVESTLKDREVRIAFTSSGPSLSQEDIEELFVGFIPDKHAEETYSSRLAMYLARNNAERLGGRVWAESESGRGTVIFLALNVS